MRELSSAEVRALGTAFNVHVGDGELSAVTEQVNDNLDGLDAVYDLPTSQAARGGGDRSWSPPTESAYNHISNHCHVPPTADHSGRLAGLDVGVKDIIAVAGVPMECGSGLMRGYVPGADATVVRRLRAAGATITAKTNLDEFAGGARAVSFLGQIRNPHDVERIPGGSSGGSAVAVAVGDVDVALGTDTGGSIRMPSSHCGIVGHKPTYGLVPLSGIVENTYTLDHVGPMATTVAEAARVLDAIAGRDPTDVASAAAASRDDYRTGGYAEAVADPPAIADLTIGVIEEGLGHGEAEQTIAEAVVDRTEMAVDRLEDAGAIVHRRSIPDYEYAAPIKYVLSYVEMATNWRDAGASYRRPGRVDEGYQLAFARRASAASDEVNPYYRARLLAGAYLVDDRHGRHYARAGAAADHLTSVFVDALKGVDVLLLPTMPSVAPRLDDARSPGFAYARNTIPANVTGLPAITVPNGSIDGLPVGLELMGEPFADADLLAAASRVISRLPE